MTAPTASTFSAPSIASLASTATTWWTFIDTAHCAATWGLGHAGRGDKQEVAEPILKSILTSGYVPGSAEQPQPIQRDLVFTQDRAASATVWVLS